MKNIKIFFSAVMCGLVLAYTASAEDSKQGVIIATRVQGVATYTLESGPDPKWIPLVAGKVLMAGSTIKTGPDAQVDMVLGKNIEMPQARVRPNRIGPAADAPVRGLVSYAPAAEQNTIRMSAETTLKVDKLTISDTGVDTVSDTELDLKKGRIFANVKKLSAASLYLVKIPNGIAGVRGTFFAIDASGWCAVSRHVVDLAVIGSDGKVTTESIGEGNQYDPGTGQISPVPQAFFDLLKQTSASVNTTYLQIFSFETARSECYVSPTSGNHGKGKGKGGGGGGGGGAGGGGGGD